MQTSFNIRGVEKLQEFFKKLPRGALRAGMRAAGEYILGNEQRGLRHSEPYKYVTRKSAYGFTFFTDKQRRWFWANGGPDMIGNNRTGDSANAWTIVEKQNGYRLSISNPTRGAYYTRNDKGQARQPAKVGWRKVSAVVAANIAGAIRAANAAVKKWVADNK